MKEIRYSWNNSPTINTTSCTGGTVITSGSKTTSAPVGGATLTVCVVDNVGNVGSDSGVYNVDKTNPVITDVTCNGTSCAKQTIYLKANGFTVNYVGSDTGGSGIKHYAHYLYSDAIPLRFPFFT